MASKLEIVTATISMAIVKSLVVYMKSFPARDGTGSLDDGA